MKINKDFEVVKKHKIWFVISLCIITLGLVMFTIFACVDGNFGKGLNLGIDFTGGTRLDVEMGSTMNNDNKAEIKNVILKALNEYGIKDMNSIQLINGDEGYTVAYRTTLQKNNLVLNGSGTALSLKARLVEKVNVDNADHLIQVKTQDITAKAGSSTGFYVLLFVLAAWILIMVYVLFRFELSSAIAVLLGLIHDILVVFALMAILRIQMNLAFFGVLLAMVCYSIYNTVIVFDKIRDNARSESAKDITAADIVNKSVRETLRRVLYTTVVIVIMLASLLISGAPSIIGFAFFAILGLLIGTYSSLFIVPSAWALYKTRQNNKKGRSEYFKKKILFKRTEKTEPGIIENQKDE